MGELRRAYQGAQFQRVITIATDLLAGGRRDPQVLLALGAAHVHTGGFARAKRVLEELLRMRPADVGALVHLSMASQALGRLDEAQSHLDRALALEPDNIPARARSAELALLRGSVELAGELLDAAPADRRDHPLLVAACARLWRARDEDQRAIEPLRRSLRREGLSPAQVRANLFLLAHALDRCARHDEAFETCERANALHTGSFDAHAHARGVDDMIGAWSASTVGGMPRADPGAERALLIVGMPRSGTSLVERILARAPGIAPGGELPFFAHETHALAGQVGSRRTDMLLEPRVLSGFLCSRIARRYEQALAGIDAGARWVTDKMPDNIRHLGLVSLVCPGAKVIRCVRDPRDVAVSCFFQHFGGSLDWSWDLEDIVSFHKDCDRLMDHWRRVLDLDVLDVCYEALVQHPVQETRRIAEFAGVPWSGDLLEAGPDEPGTITASSDQVRRPIYTSSIGRWRRYSACAPMLSRAFEGSLALHRAI